MEDDQEIGPVEIRRDVNRRWFDVELTEGWILVSFVVGLFFGMVKAWLQL